MPGKPKRSRSASTSGVMTPRSSATIGSLSNARSERLEEAGPRPLRPPPVDRGRGVARHLPVRLEAAEVVEPHAVDEGEHGAEAVDPPGVAGARERVPAVERVAPQLSGGAEVVGGHAGLESGPAVGGELEDLRVRPDVGAVVGDEDRDVAHDLDPAVAGLRAHRGPLLEEQPLLELDLADLARELASRPLERRRLAPDERAVPRVPRRPAVRVLEGHEEREVRQPGAVRATEARRAASTRGAPPFFSNAANARARIGRLKPITAPKSTSSSGKDGALARSAADTRPSSRSRSRLTSSGLPANAEKHWYGESP